MAGESVTLANLRAVRVQLQKSVHLLELAKWIKKKQKHS
jgi:hypothetical protein